MDKRNLMLFMILLVYAFSATTGWIFSQELRASPATSTEVATSSAASSINIYYILFLFVSIAVFLIIIRKAKPRLKRIMEIYIVGITCLATIFLVSVYGTAFNLPGFAIVTISVWLILLDIYLYWKLKYRFFNCFGIITAIFINAVIGIQLSLLTTAIILIAFSVYDYIAVILSGIMMGILKFYLGDGNPLPIFITTGDARIVSQRLEHQGEEPKELNYTLGLGDCIIPCLFVVSAFTSGFILAGYAAIMGVMVGSYINLWIVKKYRKAIPALPCIAICELLLAGIALL